MKNRRTLAEARHEFIGRQGETCSFDDAQQRIIAEFAGGQRRAEGIPLPAGIEHEPISEALWQQAIEPAPVTGLEPPWMRGRAVVTVDFDTGIATAPGGRGYTYIREILDPPMPADQAPPKAPPTPLRPKNQGGRPRKYDWEQFYIWAAEIADKDSLPNRPKLMKQLYEKMGAEWGCDDLPAESTVRSKLRRLYESLKLPEE